MPVFKCKMCGGTLEINENQTIATCEYCGTQQTLPKLDSDRRANLYDRANHFRRNNEYDKAMGIYEQILNEDSTDAEAYWSLVLCRYGIEYVEDPATHKRVPTVNRAQFTSIFDDADYQSALQYADGSQRLIYEEEAKEINDIQKGILAISQKEEPFDVFICYKETDNNGRRTQDSVLANDLYHQLTQEGFKVFFSRITLEDKLGTAYEPYIFAALHSAKVMVVLGTRPEYFNAVWVKNEWSRFLSLIKSGAKKVLIPAYRDMDPYDLPEEFSHLQAQDMSKLGFMQDLIRGIKKLTEADEPHTLIKETVTVNAVNANIAPLLKRAFMFLEDGDFSRADEFCEQVLNQEPENAEAYLGQLMAELQVRRQGELADCSEPFDNNANYQKAVRFADEKLAAALKGYIVHINERNENQRLIEVYDNAVTAMQMAKTEKEFKDVAEAFQTIRDFKDANALAEQCLEKAEYARKDAIYASAKELMTDGYMHDYKMAIQEFRSISGWQDANEQVAICERKIEELKVKEEVERIAAEKRKKRNKIIGVIVAFAVAVCVVFLIVLNTVIMPSVNYNKAIALCDAGDYQGAINAFVKLEDYKDSTEKLSETKYIWANKLVEQGSYADAVNLFETIEGYKDSAEKIAETKYIWANKLVEQGSYVDAVKMFEVIEDYKDSAEKKMSATLLSIKSSKVGDIITFGSYEQDNDTYNGKETIEWKVLAKEGSKALVISKYGLDVKPYNTESTSVTWETCSLRKWLNSDFLNNAFSSEEQAKILSSNLKNPDNVLFDTKGGNNTTDKVFLLSIDEAKKYFKTDEERKASATAYAKAQGAYVVDNGSCWLLRSPGYNRIYAACVFHDGGVYEFGYDVYYRRGRDDVYASSIVDRPALWINFEE